jgi:uncharacterized membrane protein
MGTERFSNVTALQFAWNTFRNHLGPLLTLGGAGVMLALLSEALGRHNFGEKLIGVGIQFLQALMWLLLVRVSFRLYDGETVELSEPRPLVVGFWNFLLTLILFWVVVAFGLIVILLPGVLLAITFGFAPLISAEGEKDIAKAFTRSAQLSEGSRWRLFGLWLMLAGLNLLGVLALGIGIVVTVPLSALCFVYAYRALQGRHPASSDEPSLGRREEMTPR